MTESMGGFDGGAIVGQIQRLTRLDTSVFDEVRDAESQTIPAVIVVVGSIVLSALGGWFWLAIEFNGLDTGKIIVNEVLFGSIIAIALWVAWALITQVVLLNLSGVEADRMALLRCMAFRCRARVADVAAADPDALVRDWLGERRRMVRAHQLRDPGHRPQRAAESRRHRQPRRLRRVSRSCSRSWPTRAGWRRACFVHGADISEYLDRGFSIR